MPPATSPASAPFVFLDGRTFSRACQVKQAVQAAESSGARWKILHLHPPDEIALARLQQTAAEHPAKNRDPHLYRTLKSSFETITRPKLDVDTSRPLAECVRLCAEYLKQEG